MRISLFILSVMLAFTSAAQEARDTVFQIRGSSCSCKFNLDPAADKEVMLSGGHGIGSDAQQPAYYSKEEKDWQQFLKKNLNTGLKGKDEVEVRFQVNKNGDLSHFELLSASPAQKFQEVVRVLKLSGKWFPSVRNGYCIQSSLRQVFEL
jgi:hypothetical protein